MFILDSKLFEYKANEEPLPGAHVLIIDSGLDRHGAPSLEEAEITFKALGFITSISAPEPGLGALNEGAKAHAAAPADFVVFHADFEHGELRKIADEFCSKRGLEKSGVRNWTFLPSCGPEAQSEAALDIALVLEERQGQKE